MVAFSRTAQTFFVGLFQPKKPARIEHENTHWENVKHSIEEILRAEFLRQGFCLQEGAFVLLRDNASNQCTLYIRNISIAADNPCHKMIEEWVEKSRYSSHLDLGIIRIYSTSQHSYTACIQSPCPYKMQDGLQRLLRVQ